MHGKTSQLVSHTWGCTEHSIHAVTKLGSATFTTSYWAELSMNAELRYLVASMKAYRKTGLLLRRSGLNFHCSRSGLETGWKRLLRLPFGITGNKLRKGRGGAKTRTGWKGWGRTNDKKRLKRFKASSVPHSSSAVVLELPQAKNILSLKVLTAPCRLPPSIQLSLSPLSNVTPTLLPPLLRIPAFTVTAKWAPSSSPGILSQADTGR